MTDDQPEVCETCGEGPVQRVLYPVAVHFKGSGFYTTDYGRGSRKQSRDGDKPSDSGSEKGDKKDKDVKKVAESSSDETRRSRRPNREGAAAEPNGP